MPNRPPAQDRPLLLAVPNVSEGRAEAAIEAIGNAFSAGRAGAAARTGRGAPPDPNADRDRPAHLLDVHSDPDHHRSVFTLAARQGDLAAALVAGAAEALARIDLRPHEGLHPRVGALDVAPVVYLEASHRGAACAEALTAAALLGEDLDVPVFLYGDLATAPERRERAPLRAGGTDAVAERLARGDLDPDYGPPRAHPSAGVVLVTARPPLLAFNLDLASDDLELARRIAAELREGAPGGFPGVRAIGLSLPARGRAQVSMNVHDHRAAPLAELVAAVRRRGAVAEAELVGLAPAAALEGFPPDVPLRGFDPRRHVIENALGSLA